MVPLCLEWVFPGLLKLLFHMLYLEKWEKFRTQAEILQHQLALEKFHFAPHLKGLFFL